jgi:hypothetical protein
MTNDETSYPHQGRCVRAGEVIDGTKLMVIANTHGLPLALHTALAHPYKFTLVEPDPHPGTTQKS